MAENSDTQSSMSDSTPAPALAPNPSDGGDASKRPQIPTSPYFPPLQHGDIHMLPIIYPVLVPDLVSSQNLEQMNRGPGIYAVPVIPCTGTVTGIPTNTLIPLTYSTLTRTTPPEAGAGSGEQSQVGQQQLQQPQQLAPQRQIVVRRFQIAFQLDLLLILKLAAVIFIFNQDGSRQRLALLVFFASIVYLYQTGALTPLMRWVSTSNARGSCSSPATTCCQNGAYC